MSAKVRYSVPLPGPFSVSGEVPGGDTAGAMVELPVRTAAALPAVAKAGYDIGMSGVLGFMAGSVVVWLIMFGISWLTRDSGGWNFLAGWTIFHVPISFIGLCCSAASAERAAAAARKRRY